LYRPAGRRHHQENNVGLVTHDDEPVIEVQKVDHPGRVHFETESDDIKAEVRRLEALGVSCRDKMAQPIIRRRRRMALT
jgi:hypothetical protein